MMNASATAGASVASSDPNARIDRDDIVTDGNYRIEIELFDLGNIDGEQGNAAENVDQRAAVDGRLPAHPVEHLLRADAIDHRLRVAGINGRDAEDDVAQCFRVNPTEPEHDERSKKRIAGDSGNQLGPTGHHALHEHTAYRGIRNRTLRVRNDFRVSRPHVIFA